MMSVEQIFQAIQSLPLSERRGLLERLSRDLGEPTPEPADAAEGEPDLVGFLADEPELADEIEKIATVERAGEDMRSWDDATGPAR